MPALNAIPGDHKRKYWCDIPTGSRFQWWVVDIRASLLGPIVVKARRARGKRWITPEQFPARLLPLCGDPQPRTTWRGTTIWVVPNTSSYYQSILTGCHDMSRRWRYFHLGFMPQEPEE